MERKIGEIFELGGEWYQCVESDSCGECSLFPTECGSKVFGPCSKLSRTDNKHVIFKKLEKVGEPFTSVGKLYQHYKVFDIDNVYGDVFWCVHNYKAKTLTIEIKEDMEEKKLIELLSEKVHNAWMKEKEAQGFSYGKDYDKEKKKHPDMLPYNELKEEVKEYDRATVRAVLQAQKELQSKYNYNNLKSFDLEAAKAGKPVCTRNGQKARIICFDFQSIENTPIVAAVQVTHKQEVIANYYEDGRQFVDGISELDLIMLFEKKGGWVNVDKRSNGDVIISKPYPTRDEAIHNSTELTIDTVNIEWEE